MVLIRQFRTSVSKVKNISGFPEWLPEERIVELRFIDRIRAVYESFGFCSVETRSVELIESMCAKGVVDKEIYAIKRLRSDQDGDAELALHFDLTVPLARYVAENFGKLSFPFRRYQIQKSWRGERPQKGRFREFYQCDVDIIARDNLPLAADAEVLSAIAAAVNSLQLGSFSIGLNNRKLLHGMYAALGVEGEKRSSVIGVVDKFHKIGPDGVARELTGSVGISSQQAERIVELSGMTFPAEHAAESLIKLGLKAEQFSLGVEELGHTIACVPVVARQCMRVDLSLARGLDYYTGLTFETFFDQYREFGSVASGGRYDDLAGQFINQKLPGVGGSIGLTRLLSFVFEKKLQPLEVRSPAEVLVTVFDEQQRAHSNQIASDLRAHGIKAEVFLSSPKLGKQIEYAERLGIREVLFIDSATGAIQVKDLKSKQQRVLANPAELIASRKN